MVYRARHVQLEQVVALKEYFPADLALRDGGTVYPRSTESTPHYEDGKRRFLEEAKCIAQFKDDPGVVACLGYFSANGTAYIVLEHVDSLSLAEVLREREAAGRPQTDSELRSLVLPLLESLERLHAADVLHRDIKPSNILLRRADGMPVLIDFGAAKQRAALHSKSVAPYTEGYAALEQVGAGKLGPWTDIYAIGAVMWRVVAGSKPPWQPPNPTKVEIRAAAVLRGEADPLPSAAELGGHRFSLGLLTAIDNCLKIRDSDRISDCRTLLSSIEGSASTTESQNGPSNTGRNGLSVWSNLIVLTLISIIVLLIALWTEDGGSSRQPAPDSSTSPKAVRMPPDTEVEPNDQSEDGTTIPDSSAQTSEKQNEGLFWQSIKESTDGADYEAYLEQYPTGNFAILARKRLQGLVAGSRPMVTEEAPPVTQSRAWRAGEVFRDCEGCPEMVVIPAGRFRMGCGSEENCFGSEKPVHPVTVASFALGVYEVTFEEYDRFAHATGRGPPRDKGWGRGGRPVINVSWRDGQAYVDWLSEQTGKKYRLPSEAEWEYASRAGTETLYWWGAGIGRSWAHCWGCGSAYDDDKATAPAGSFVANRWGLHDTAGNVWEWVADCWHENYARAPSDGSAWLEHGEGDCGRRVLRGGSWSDGPMVLRSAVRLWNDAGSRSDGLGLRVSRTLD